MVTSDGFMLMDMYVSPVGGGVKKKDLKKESVCRGGRECLLWTYAAGVAQYAGRVLEGE